MNRLVHRSASLSKTQTDVFVQSEGDRWFQRNRHALEKYDPEVDPIAQVMKLYDLRPRRLVELGAANGIRVATLAKILGCDATAVEPSDDAIADGRRCFPHVTYVKAPIHAVTLVGSFDTVIVNFVLHWIDRALLLESIAKIDALVSDGGHLILGDFMPNAPTRAPYHHLPGEEVYTYKQDYGAIFGSSGVYEIVAVATGAHGASAFSTAVADRDRSAVWLLRKTLQGRYSPLADPVRSTP
jgi:SAM-dependent methyltransferase